MLLLSSMCMFLLLTLYTMHGVQSCAYVGMHAVRSSIGCKRGVLCTTHLSYWVAPDSSWPTE